MNTGIMILAAGKSSRMGMPKQLLTFKGKTLLATAIAAALATNFHPIVVVLGANAQEILTTHQPLDVSYVINERWMEGMSSSIAAGLTELLKRDRNIDNVIITLADQVHINPNILTDLLARKTTTEKNIIASTYAKTIGTPTLFNKCYFNELLALSGDNGAKIIVKHNPHDLETISFELGKIDIDTETDYKNLIDQQ